MFTKRILSIIVLLSALATAHNVNGQCANSMNWSFNPPPVNGAYEPGQVITVCLTITQYQQASASWLHGIVLNFPPGWDVSTVTNTSTPPSCSGSGGGNWAWYPNGTTGTGSGQSFGAGFFYDSGSGGPMDGNPGNNYGDPCTNLGANFTFCFDITIDPVCGGGGNPLDGSFITPSVQITGDGQSGSWGGSWSPCSQNASLDPDINPIIINCCDAESGVSPGTLPICETGTFNLIDQLGLPVDAGGTWTGPGVYADPNPGLGTFDPTTDPAGDYTYTVVGTDNCESSTTITMEFITFGTVQNIADCSGTPTNINPLITTIPVPAGGTWTDPNGTPLVGDLVDPNVNPPGLFTYSYYDGGNCLTNFQVLVIFAAGGAAGSPGTVDVCTSDPGCFSPFTGLTGNPTPGGNWLVYDATGTGFLDYWPEWDNCVDLATYAPNGYTGDFIFTYIFGNAPCEPQFVNVTANIFNPVNPGINTTTSLCVTDPPVLLTSLLDGNPDLGLVWTDDGGNVISNMFDPSGYAPNSTLFLLYEGGLAGTSCQASALLTLTILPTYAYAGEDNTITVCQSDAPIFMRDSLLDNGTDVIQIGGIWQNNAGVAIGTDYFVPGNNAPGTYTFTYNIISPCASDQSTLTIIVEPTLNPGADGTLDICSNETNVALSGGLNGPFDTGGNWTDALNNSIPGGIINGNAVTNGAVYTYTVGTDPCEETSTVTINLIPAPNAGVLTTTPQTYCDSDAPFALMTLFTTNPSVMPAPGVAGWTGPLGTAVTTVNPASGSSASGVYTYTIQDYGCGPASVSITITITDTPNAGTDGTLTVCPNGTGTVNLFTSLTGGPAAGGTWTYPSGGSFSGIFNPATPDPAGVYTYSVGSNCTDQATVTVSYSVLPNPGTSNTITVCAGDPAFAMITGMGPGAVEGSWSFGGNPISGTFTPGTSFPGVYTNTVPAGLCPSVTATLTVNVTPLPNAGADATVSFCETAGTVDLRSYLNGTPETGGVWTDAGGVVMPNSFNVSTLCGNSFVFTYTVGTGTCSSAAVLSFDVICSPSAGSDGTIDLCSNSGTFSLFDGLTGTYDTPGTWTNSSGGSVSNFTAMDPSTLGTGDTFTYTVTALPCAAATADVVVTVTPEITTANLDVSCTPSQTTYIVSFNVSGGDGSYILSGSTPGSITAGLFTSIPIATGTPFSVTISDGSACADVTVSGISPICTCPATASFASGNATICIGSSTDLEIDLGGGIDGNYGFEYTDGTNTYTVLNSSDGHIITVSPTVTTTYTLTNVSDGFCNNIISNSVTITVDPLNYAGNDVSLDYCGDGSSLVLVPASGEPLNGTFSPPSVTLSAANSGVQATYTMSAGQCPDDVAIYTINIDEPIAITSAQATCEANQTEYTVTIVITGGTQPYTVNGENVVGDTYISPIITMGTNYSYVIEDSGVCAQVTGTIPSPNCNCPVSASFSTGNQTICIGSSTNIGLNLTGGIDGDYTVSYDAGGSPVFPSPSGLSNGDVITVSPTTTTTYTLTGVQDSNCQGSVNGSVTITVEPLPNAGADVSAEYCADGTIIIFTPGPGQPGGGFFTPPSVTKDVANSGVYTYTMPGNVCPDDQANYTIDFIQELEVTNLTAVCASNQLTYTVSFTIVGGTPPYFIDGVQTFSPFFSEVVPASNATYTYTISDSGPCADVIISEIAPDCNCIAEGSLTGSQAICNGDGAEITFNGTGDAPFNITYTNSVTGIPTSLNSINNGHVITVYPTVTTTYMLDSVSDSYCAGVVSGNAVTITVDNPVVVTGITPVCNNTAEGYRVHFNFTGGVGPTTFSPGNTSSTPGVYISPVYASGSNYSISVNDAGACPEQVFSGSFTCACLSDAGTIPTAGFEVCYGESATVTANGVNLDGNDVLQYILHDGDGSSIGTIIATSADGTFDFNYGSMTPGAAYYITAAVGNNAGGGNVDLNGLCTSLSNGVQVVMNPLSTASISGGAIVCPGESVDLTVTFTGEAPFDFEYAIDGNNQGLNIVPTGNTFTLTVTQPGNYTLVSVSDDNCTGSVSGSATVQNYATPTATLTGEPTVCEGSGDGPQVVFTGNGPWSLVYSIDGVEQPPVTTNFLTYTIPVETDGNYALVSLEGSYCTGTVSGSQNITILDAPTASITGGGTVCAGDAATFEVILTGVSPWTVQYTVDGIPQNPLTGITSGYSFESSVDGDYVLVSVTDANCQGEVLASQAALIVNPLPTAEVTANKSTICIGEELQLGIDLEGVPPYTVTYVINGDTTTATGLYSDFLKTLSPQNPITFEVVYVSDGSNPTCSSEIADLTYIDAVVLPNAPVLTNDTICATNGPVTIGVNAAPGLTYSWSPETSLSSPNTSHTLFQPFLSGPVAKDFKYVLTATNGQCSASDTMIVTVDPGPKARFTYTPKPISSEDPTVFFKNNTVGGTEVIYFWEFDSLDTSNDFEPSYKFPDGINDSYTVTLTAIDPVTGCVDDYKDILKIKPEMLIYVPNAFTPDADGKNDLWAPVLTNVDADNYKLSVYDRLGVLVFTTTDVKQKWNGNKMNGDYYVEPGVYVWMIETKNQVSLEEVNMKGIVTVVR